MHIFFAYTLLLLQMSLKIKIKTEGDAPILGTCGCTPAIIKI
jgi:hypothetical protein